MEPQNSDTTFFMHSGVPGLDTILAGGLTRDRLYLIEGEPGTGKTTLALQFLNEGVRCGESVLYITLAETSVELRAVARSHGWDMGGIHIEEIIPDENILDPDQQYTIFHPSEIELGTTTRRILAAVDQYQPSRVALDSLSELQLLAESPLRYRRQVLALKQYLASRSCTTIFLDDRTALSTDLQVRSVAHGVITLEMLDQAYGSERRRLRVVKYRGIAFHGGAHDYKIVRGGLQVYPRLVAPLARQPAPAPAVERRRGTRRAARRRPRRRHEHPDLRPARHRQVDAGGAVRVCRQRAPRTLRHVPVRGGAQQYAEPLQPAGHGTQRRDGRRPADDTADRPGRTGAGPVLAGGGRRRRTGRPRGRHRQLERLPERGAGRALPDHLPARAADLSGPARRRHADRRRPAGHDRHRHDHLGRRQLHRRQRHHAALL